MLNCDEIFVRVVSEADSWFFASTESRYVRRDYDFSKTNDKRFDKERSEVLYSRRL